MKLVCCLGSFTSQPKSSGLVLGRRPLGAILYSSSEPGELSQWLCHDDSTINIVVVIIIICSKNLFSFYETETDCEKVVLRELFGRVNSCVCFDNYKLFVLLVAYSSVYCFFITATSLQYFIKFWTVSSFFLLIDGIQSLHMPALSPASQAGPMCKDGKLITVTCYLLLWRMSSLSVNSRDARILRFCTHRILCRISHPVQNLGSCAELRKIYEMAQKMRKFCWFLLTVSLHMTQCTRVVRAFTDNIYYVLIKCQCRVQRHATHGQLLYCLHIVNDCTCNTGWHLYTS